MTTVATVTLRPTLTHRLPISLLMLSLSLYGCAFTHTLPDSGQPSSAIGSLASLPHILTLAVWLEDQCEAPESDDRRATMLEALQDGLVIPTHMLFAVGAVAVLGTAWSLYDRVTLPAGVSLPNRPHMVMEYVKPHWASPRPQGKEKSQGTDHPIIWLGCLAGHDDS